MKKRTMAAILAGVMLASTVGISSAAYAYKDSSVQMKACGTQFGKLSIYQKGSGNSWAPGDWDNFSMWHPTSSTYRWVYDYQSSGTGGGGWRNVANDNYTSISAGCSVYG